MINNNGNNKNAKLAIQDISQLVSDDILEKLAANQVVEYPYTFEPGVQVIASEDKEEIVVNEQQSIVVKRKAASHLAFERTAEEAVYKRCNGFMKGGNKATVRNIRNDCSKYLYIEGILHHYNLTFNQLVKKVRDELKPVVETVSVKRAGSIYQVPHPVVERRGYSLATRLLVNASLKRARSGLRVSEARGQELCAVITDVINIGDDNPTSEAMKQRITVHKTAKANRVFSHLRLR